LSSEEQIINVEEVVSGIPAPQNVSVWTNQVFLFSSKIISWRLIFSGIRSLWLYYDKGTVPFDCEFRKMSEDA
jgi:hypothetical protein